MLPSKLKRKVTEDKGKSNGVEKHEKEELDETQSDYESDEVSFVVAKTCAFIYHRVWYNFRKIS